MKACSALPMHRRLFHCVDIIHKNIHFIHTHKLKTSTTTTAASSTATAQCERRQKSQRVLVCTCVSVCNVLALPACSLVRRAQLIAHTISFFNHAELMNELICTIISSLSHGMRICIYHRTIHYFAAAA